MKRFLKFFILALVVALAVSVFVISAGASGGNNTVVINFGDDVSEIIVNELPEYSVGDYVEYKNGDFRASYRVIELSKSENTLVVTLDTIDARYYQITDADGNVTYVTNLDIGEDLGKHSYSSKGWYLCEP